MKNQNEMPYPLVTVSESIESGMTPSQLRATANSLERISREGYVSEIEVSDADGGFDHNAMSIVSPYDSRKCKSTARHLRMVAKAIELKSAVENL